MSLNTLVGNDTSEPASSRRGLPSWLLPVGLLAGFATLFAFLFGEKLLPAREVHTVPVITVRAGDDETPAASSGGQLLFQASGWAEPDPYPIMVPALVNGVVAEVHVLEGESVEKGQLLATLIDDEARLAVEQAEAEAATQRARIAAHCSQVPEVKARLAAARNKVTAEKASLLEIEDEYARLKSLPKGATPERDILSASLRVERQKAMVAEAESEIPRINAELETIDYERIMMGQLFQEIETREKIARLALDRHRIVAPVSGRILRLFVSPGQKRMLAMDDPQSANIVSLYQPEHMQARIDVPLNEAAGLAVGQPVELVTDLLPDTTFKGTVTRITGEADLQRNTLQAKVAIENPDDRLRTDMLMRAKFFSARSPDSPPAQADSNNGRLLVFAPLKALFDTSNDEARAWVATTAGTAELRSVRLGRAEREGHRQVLDGLRSGEKLILPPHDGLEPGTRVSISNP